MVGNFDEKNHLEDLQVDGRMVLTCTLNKHDEDAWFGLIWLL
jgi:hypothetical protein